MFEEHFGRRDDGYLKRLAGASLGSSLLVLGAGVLVGLVFGLGAEVLTEEQPVDVTFFKAPPPPPPAPTLAASAPPAPAAPKPPPPLRNKAAQAPAPASLPPVKPLEVPSIPPSSPPSEADPSQEIGSVGDPSSQQGGGDPFGQRGGEAGGKVGGRVDGQTGGQGTAAAAGPSAIVLPAGATPPVDLTADVACPYPEQARIARMEGVVQLKTIVSERGELTLVKIIRSNPVFDAAALECLKRKRFQPAEYNGQKIAVFRNLTFNFRP